MTRKCLCFILLPVILLIFLSTTIQAAKFDAKSTKHVTQLSAVRAMAYSFPDEHGSSIQNLSADNAGRTPLGTSVFDKSTGALSPGVTVGDTWYDYQQNCSMGRMVEYGPYDGYTGEAMVHFGWMQMPGNVFALRKYYYNVYYTGAGSLGGAAGLQADDEYSGYVNVDVSPDNRAVVGGHQQINSKNQSQFFWDFGPGFYYWSTSRIPEATASYYQAGGAGTSCIWPKFSYQYGTDTVTHVIAEISEDADVALSAIYYFRKVGFDAAGTWDSPPYCIDSVVSISHDITCDRTGDKVAIAWLANLVYQQTNCDTCSGISPYTVDQYLVGQMDNDVYYQISNDQGATWQPRVNLTKVTPGEAAFKAYCDLSCLIDSDGNLHLLWSAQPWPSETNPGNFEWSEDFYLYKARLLHWSEAFDNAADPYPYIRTVADHTYIPSDSCGPPAWSLTLSKMSVSECDGKLYALWAQFNDVPSGVTDDCSAWGIDNYPTNWTGSTNGELWLSVSTDNGVTWDAQRNLTNSYSKGCDPLDPAAEPCQSDYWPSMSRFGHAIGDGENWSGAVVVDPTGAYAGSPNDGEFYYLDVMYVHDPDAGGIVQDEGSWQSADMNWFRVPCVEPIPNPNFVPSFWSIGDPTWMDFGTTYNTDLTIENTGNVTLNYSIAIQQDNGPAGWLSVSGFSGSLASGFDNTDVGTIGVSAVGIPGPTPVVLEGRLIFTGNDPDFPDTISISMIVADTVQMIVWDTVNTDCVSLAVANTATVGRQGAGKVNMDFYNAGDCDTTATVYLYDNSPMVGWLDGGDTVFNWSIWGADMLDPTGFRPIGGEKATVLCTNDAEVFQSGTFVTHDSSIALERIWFAPTGTTPNCNYIIEYLKVWSYDGLAHSDLVIGDAFDWDIPNDSANAYNAGGISPTKKLVYQIGTEYNQDDTTYPYNCQPNDARFGGVAFIGSYYNGVASGQTDPFCAFAETNDSLQATTGFIPDLMYRAMTTPGYRKTDSVLDLHSAMCYEPYYDLSPTGYYEVFNVVAAVENGTATDLATAVDAARTWFTAKGGRAMVADLDDNGVIDICDLPGGCCVDPRRGNVDMVGTYPTEIDIADLVYLVNYMFSGGAAPDCRDEANVDGLGTDPTDIDIADLVYLVSYMFSGGASPVACP